MGIVVAAGLMGGATVGSGFVEPPAGAPAQPPAKTNEPAGPAAATDAYVLGFKMKDIDGKEVDLAQYKGKVVVIVNVASQCGYTSQYEGLEKLYREKKDKGLVVLGFPANNFGGQEPGTSEDIKAVCSGKYHATFPMFEKIGVVSEATAKAAKEKGKPITGGPPDQHPLYAKLAAQPAPVGGDPKWNFTKFVVDRSGNVVARFDAKTRPALEPELLKKVDELLGEKAPVAAGGGTPAPSSGH